MNPVYRKSFFQGFSDGENTLVCRLAKPLVLFAELEAVAHQPFHSRAEHAERLLQRLLKSTADRHDLADALHLRADLALHVPEFLQVPAWDFDNDIIEGGLEASARDLGDGILHFSERIAQCQLRRDERKRISGPLPPH